LTVKEQVEKLVEWLEEKVREAGARGFIVGLSGGIDSAVTAVLCQKACPENTMGIIMPCHSHSKDAEDAKLLAQTFNLPYKTVILDQVFDKLLEAVGGPPYETSKTDMAVANIKPRLRMATLYYFAARYNLLVAGTGNKCELLIGYFTKYGDGGVDVQPLGNLVKTQVQVMAKFLGVPDSIIEKPPSAGLWIGQDDQKELGISYKQLDQYIITGEADEKVKKVVNSLSKKNRHKHFPPPIPPFSWELDDELLKKLKEN